MMTDFPQGLIEKMFKVERLINASPSDIDTALSEMTLLKDEMNTYLDSTPSPKITPDVLSLWDHLLVLFDQKEIALKKELETMRHKRGGITSYLVQKGKMR